ncbi:neuromedin-U [Aulostomus maculatus]
MAGWQTKLGQEKLKALFGRKLPALTLQLKHSGINRGKMKRTEPVEILQRVMIVEWTEGCLLVVRGGDGQESGCGRRRTKISLNTRQEACIPLLSRVNLWITTGLPRKAPRDAAQPLRRTRSQADRSKNTGQVSGKEMKTFQCQSQSAQRRASSSGSSPSSSPSGSAMSPLGTASVTLATLLILTVPTCRSAPAELQQATTDERQLLSQIGAVCSAYVSADLTFSASDVLGELCILLLVQKSKERGAQEDSKRETPSLHPLLHLLSHLHTRRERGVSMRAELQGPGGIQSRGYFLYRPRNGRRSLEYE